MKIAALAALIVPSVPADAADVEKSPGIEVTGKYNSVLARQTHLRSSH